MFNVTVLRLKDLTKLMIGIILLSLIIVFVSKEIGVEKNKNNENISNSEVADNSNDIIKKIEEGINFLGKSNMTAINQTIPVISNINEEYGKLQKKMI